MDLDDCGRGGRGEGWRGAFLNRHRRGDAGDEVEGDLSERREPRRSLSRPRASSRPPDAPVPTEQFDQKAVLEQDRALIEQLSQRPTRERPAVRKPPPPPKVKPYRSASSTPRGDKGDTLSSPSNVSAPPSPARSAGGGSSPRRWKLPVHGTPASEGVAAPGSENVRELPASAQATGLADSLPPVVRVSESLTSQSPKVPIAPSCAGVVGRRPQEAEARPVGENCVQPIVPRSGELFTAADIDTFMDSLGDSKSNAKEGGGAAKLVVPQIVEDRSKLTSNFGDVANDFFRDHKMEVPTETELTKETRGSSSFHVPERRGLRDQINAMDSWLEEDMSARDKLGDRSATAIKAHAAVRPVSTAELLEQQPVSNKCVAGENDCLTKLDELKRCKKLGQVASPLTLKALAQQAKPLFPGLPLEKLVQSLRLFASARYQDHDLYLRILGEIPVQVRGISPEMLTTCLRVLWRIRLHEETYVELLSMEAMNMIRAKRKPAARAPRRPGPKPAPLVEGEIQPAPPASPPPEAPAPFSPMQLIHIGNSLTRLNAKHHTRFMDVFQEQLALAIPRMTQEECELVCPTLALSQLMHDPLRRVFLERCAQVDAGKAPWPSAQIADGAAPDIGQHQRLVDKERRRLKHFRNIFIIEASVRKETFSFFTSLPAEVRSYLDRLHTAAGALPHEGQTQLAAQVAAVLDQLGVTCSLDKLAGPLSLHVSAKATAPRAEVQEIVYDCSDATCYYAVPQDDKSAMPQFTSLVRLRHRLLQRLGVTLTHITAWEWNQMSEAQRINYMVKVQSLQ